MMMTMMLTQSRSKVGRVVREYVDEGRGKEQEASTFVGL
jgi:hypothetical protein